MKGIILAAGKSSRLFPASQVINKALLPVYDKPLIYYPLSTLMLAGIKEVLIIVQEDTRKLFENLLGNGNKFGMNIEYAVQKVQRGTADALIIGADFIGNDSVCLIFGDNIFYKSNFDKILCKLREHNIGASILGCFVEDPTAFGVVEFDSHNNVISLEEKPAVPKSNYAVPGLYFYDNNAVEYAKNLSLSNRGELEITDLNKIYLNNEKLKVEILDDLVWFDTGTPEGMLSAAIEVKELQKNGGIISCVEKIAFDNGWIDKNEMVDAANQMKNSDYGKYILSCVRS